MEWEGREMDCTIEALVPVSSDYHRSVETTLWENRFTKAKELIKEGIPFIPSWWDIKNQQEYENELIKKGIRSEDIIHIYDN